MSPLNVQRQYVGTEQRLPATGNVFRGEPSVELCAPRRAMSFHSRNAMLIAKYYSLGLEIDGDLNVVGVTNEAGPNRWLDDSEDQARRSIAALVAANIDHTTCAQIYEIGRVYEGRDQLDRLDALDYYFQASVTAQVLKHIAQSASKSSQ